MEIKSDLSLWPQMLKKKQTNKSEQVYVNICLQTNFRLESVFSKMHWMIDWIFSTLHLRHLYV